ncbi:MAG: hypothetical protein WDO17_21730 [Alphaproteobacteria bacterium]
MDLEVLSRRVLAEIDNYRYEFPDGMIGGPWSPTHVDSHLRQMRSALVAPYWAEITRRDSLEQIHADQPLVHPCAVVADDGKGTLLAFDPQANEFLLAESRGDKLVSFGVTGDAVGCFMAR